MRKVLVIVTVVLCVFSCRSGLSQTPVPEAGAQSSYYVYNGKTLEARAGDPGRASYSEWQIWLNPRDIPISQSSGLAYVRWGVIDGSSAEAVLKQLAADQAFERAYTNFFGENSWGRFTFSYPVGPVAVSYPAGPVALAKDAHDTHKPDSEDLRLKADLLNQALEPVVVELRASLVNGQGATVPGMVQQDLEEVRDSIEGLARFYDKLSRLPGEHSYLSQILGPVIPVAEHAQTVVPAVTAILPTVKLPVSKDWMSHSEFAGRDGTIHVTVKEIGSSAWVQQTWTGGDGSMTGTQIITIVPYQQIGSVDIRAQDWGPDRRWILRVEPTRPNAFPESLTSPTRTTVRRTYPAVDVKTGAQSIYLNFSNSRDAQDAYAFFLYHKERGI